MADEVQRPGVLNVTLRPRPVTDIERVRAVVRVLLAGDRPAVSLAPDR